MGKHLPQAVLAALVDQSQQWRSRIETGDRLPTLDLLGDLYDALMAVQTKGRALPWECVAAEMACSTGPTESRRAGQQEEGGHVTTREAGAQMLSPPTGAQGMKCERY